MSPLLSPSVSARAAGRVDVRRRVRPTPSVDLSRMTRYRGGTYSHTVDTVVFTDGSSARTDLIRLNPNIAAYSLDFTGLAPTRPSRYAADTWAAVPHLATRVHEAEVDWILRHSYPNVATPALSAALRAAGFPLGSRNITEHEAIAGTQAAIWHLTNGLELDTRPLDVPVRIHADQDGLIIEFDGDRRLGGYRVEVVSSDGAALRLEKSADGIAWQDVASSALTVAAGSGRACKTLGVGATASGNRTGYRFYRLVVEGEASIGELSFRLDGSARYRNSDAVVHLYDYLLAGARLARAAAVTPALNADDALVSDGVIGPVRLTAASPATIRAADGGEVLTTQSAGDAVLVSPGEEFYLRLAPQAVSATVRVEVPGDTEGFGGRVLTGVVRDAGRLTPLALAVPVQTLVEFDLKVRAAVPTSA